MTRIVFADGSKAMAHNLDDLYQRWILRYDDAPTTDIEQPVELFVPALPILSNHEQIRQLEFELHEKMSFLQERLSELKSERFDLGNNQWRKLRLPILKAKAEADRQLETLRMQRKLLVQNGVYETSSNMTVAMGLKAKQLRAKEDELTVEEKRYLAELTFTLDEATNEGHKRQVLRLMKHGNALAALEAQENYIETVKNQTIKLQEKLIAAYERIIDFEEGAQE